MIKINKLRVLLIIAGSIWLFSRDPFRVEYWYATGIYPRLAGWMRYLTGWMPISVGDLLYALAGLFFMWILFRTGRELIAGRGILRFWKQRWVKLLLYAVSLYVFFNLFWGLNYDRHGIAWQLRLPVVKDDKQSLSALTERLLEKTNRFAAHSNRIPGLPSDTVFQGAVTAYRQAARMYPFLTYEHPAVKSSLFGTLGNYLGYTGYFNPFTAEAQVNERIPAVLKPFVTCHEIAHQLGYAKEQEANLVGFLAARVSPDTAFLYSAYFDMFRYANAALYRVDSIRAKNNMIRLAPQAKQDLDSIRAFRIRYSNPFDRITDVLYDRFLKLNKQPAGMQSYGSVVIWLMAIFEKEGDI